MIQCNTGKPELLHNCSSRQAGSLRQDFELHKLLCDRLQILFRCCHAGYLLAFLYGWGVMDLVQMREEILSRDVTPVEKAQAFIKEKAVWKLSKAQWDLFTFSLPREVEDAINFLKLPSKCRLS